MDKYIGDGNPLFTQRFGADPGWLEYDGRLYVYLTNDLPVFDENGAAQENTYGLIKHINVISSADLVNWTDHGAIPVAGQLAPYARNSWAPSAVCRKLNGVDTFFLYFANSGAGVGVISGKSPVGPWIDPIGRNLVDHLTENCAASAVPWCFDPAVFLDDDGAAYLYFGGGIPAENYANPRSARVVRLNDDMVSIQGVPMEIDLPYFFESLDMVKRGDTYYLSYCSNFQAVSGEDTPGVAQIAYMTAKNPMGPFTYGGIVLRNPYDFFGVILNNNHHSLCRFKGKWYILYHATLVSDARGYRNVKGGQVNYRSPHINKLEFTPDGGIIEVTGDRKGVPQMIPLDPYAWTDATTLAWCDGISVDGYAHALTDGGWLAVSQADFKNGAAAVTARVRGNGVMEIRLDDLNGALAGVVPINQADWTDVRVAVTGANGVRNVYFKYKGSLDFSGWVFA
jgi:arabinoxylan arabinofuranohydrolase